MLGRVISSKASISAHALFYIEGMRIFIGLLTFAVPFGDYNIFQAHKALPQFSYATKPQHCDFPIRRWH